MDALVQLISTFSKGEASDFTSFIHRLKLKEGRKDLQLFQYLYKHGDIPTDNVKKHLYPDGNKEAYHALRKRLYKHLTDFIYNKQLRTDYTNESQINAMLSMAKYLKDNGLNKQAWKQLRKAEKLAVEAEQFALANDVMSLQLDMPLRQMKGNLQEVLVRKKKYLRLAIEDENADTAYKIINYFYRQAKTSSQAIDLQSEVERIIDEYNLDKAVSYRPSVVYKLMSILRSLAATNKDYYNFEPLLLSYYKRLDLTVFHSKSSQLHLARLQYMVAHTLFRNKKFSESLNGLKTLRQTMRHLVKTEFVMLLPKATQLYCANHFFTGNIKMALRIADARFTDQLNIQPEDQLDLKLNRAIYHFYNNDYRVAAKVLNSIGHSNAWCAKIAGLEWVVKKDILDIFIQFELGNYEIASNRVRALLRQKGTFSNQQQWARAEVFIKLVGKVVEDPEIAQTPAFADEVEGAFDWLPIEEEDLHASVYYTWLKAKLLNRDCYEVLLDLISIYEE